MVAQNAAYPALFFTGYTLDETNALEIETNLVARDNLGVILITHNLREQVKTKLTGTYLVTKQ